MSHDASVGACAAEHAGVRVAGTAIPATMPEALRLLIDIQGERALTYTLFDEYGVSTWLLYVVCSYHHSCYIFNELRTLMVVITNVVHQLRVAISDRSLFVTTCSNSIHLRLAPYFVPNRPVCMSFSTQSF